MIIAAVVGLLVITLGVLAMTGTFSSEEVSLSDEQVGENSDTATTTDTANDTYPGIERITAKHFFDGTTHTLVGEVPMPTPCDLLEIDSRVQESFPEQVILQFTVINEADMCAQVITPQRFMIEVAASEEATFSAEFQGRPVELNLLEPAPGETPADFELYIKG